MVLLLWIVQNKLYLEVLVTNDGVHSRIVPLLPPADIVVLNSAFRDRLKFSCEDARPIIGQLTLLKQYCLFSNLFVCKWIDTSLTRINLRYGRRHQ